MTDKLTMKLVTRDVLYRCMYLGVVINDNVDLNMYKFYYVRFLLRQSYISTWYITEKNIVI